MRLAVLIVSLLALGACATSLQAVPETGAYSLKYVALDGDYFLEVDKIGAAQSTSVASGYHLNRQSWDRKAWGRYSDTLFPQDEIDFNELRRLRGVNLVPAGLVSPTPSVVPPCETTSRPEYAKVQRRIIRRASRIQPLAQITMVTECYLHEGLSPSQYAGIHQRPNPYRFPTLYETVVDLDRNGRAEQRNVRIRNISKAEVVDFVRRETILPGKVRRNFIQALDRM